jgi:hypothetical protein
MWALVSRKYYMRTAPLPKLHPPSSAAVPAAVRGRLARRVLRARRPRDSRQGAGATVCGYGRIWLRSCLESFSIRFNLSNVLLGRGISRISEVMKELHRQNFAGLIAVEYEKEGDVDSDMKQNVEFARRLA